MQSREQLCVVEECYNYEDATSGFHALGIYNQEIGIQLGNVTYDKFAIQHNIPFPRAYTEARC